MRKLMQDTPPCEGGRDKALVRAVPTAESAGFSHFNKKYFGFEKLDKMRVTSSGIIFNVHDGVDAAPSEAASLTSPASTLRPVRPRL